MRRGLGRYLGNLALALDLFANAALLAGDPHQSISARAWAAKQKGHAWGVRAVAVIDWLARHLFGQGDHCQTAWTDENAPRT